METKVTKEEQIREIVQEAITDVYHEVNVQAAVNRATKQLLSIKDTKEKVKIKWGVPDNYFNGDHLLPKDMTRDDFITQSEWDAQQIKLPLGDIKLPVNVNEYVEGLYNIEDSTELLLAESIPSKELAYYWRDNLNSKNQK